MARASGRQRRPPVDVFGVWQHGSEVDLAGARAQFEQAAQNSDEELREAARHALRQIGHALMVQATA